MHVVTCNLCVCVCVCVPNTDPNVPVTLVSATAGLEAASLPSLTQSLEKQLATLTQGAAVKPTVEVVGDHITVVVPAKVSYGTHTHTRTHTL